MKRLYILSSLLVLTSGLGAKILVPDNKSDFLAMIARNPYAVVHYINYEQVGDDKLKEQALNSMKLAFSASANESAHVLAGLAFIGINSNVAPHLLADIEAEYQIKKSVSAENFSTVFLFKNGDPALDEAGNLATLNNAFDQADLGIFIQQYLGEYVSYHVQQAQARAAMQPARTVTRVVEQPVYRYSTSYAQPVYVDPYYG